MWCGFFFLLPSYFFVAEENIPRFCTSASSEHRSDVTGPEPLDALARAIGLRQQLMGNLFLPSQSWARAEVSLHLL